MENTLEAREIRIPAQNLKIIHLKSMNYVTYFMNTEEDEVIIRYNDNRFRRLTANQVGADLYLEEKMTINIYGMFRLIELMEGNRLTIEIPSACEGLEIVAESTTMDINMRGLHIAGADLRAGTGSVRIQELSFSNRLSVISSAGRIICELPGTASDYDIVCRAERDDLRQPQFDRNPGADRKITLKSGTSVPELIFLN